MQDITELRKKDEELLIKSVVIKEIHHRVKNNLQTIASLLRLQERRAECDETKIVLRDCVNRVNSIAIVHEYLSQQDTGLIDVGKVAKGIYQAIISSMLNPDFALQADFKAAEVQLPSDKATSIALILNELLQNTIEHAFEGRMSGMLQVRFAEEEQQYVLSIADDGVGLPEGFSLNGRRQSLGLKIIKTMAEADLQGSFTLTNREEGGTLALVTIPKGAWKMLKKLRILLADDEAILRLDLREMLADAGHEIVGEAANGQEAIKLAKELKPDFIIMDVKMPIMDGITAAKVIAAEDIAPVLLLTAYSQQDIVEKASDAGVIAYLVKPIREEQLFPAMEVAVKRFAEVQKLNIELDQLKDSLETRKLLDRAKGILMAAHGMTEQEAYRKMQQFSMARRISLKELAESVIAAAAKR